jgi:hypothetical protein
MIQIELQPEIESQLKAQAKAHGVSFSEYLKDLLVRQAEQHAEGDKRRSIAEAIESIRELRKGNRLGGLKIKDLVHEGHKY